MQETCSNLETLVQPLTILDQCITNNVDYDNIIEDTAGHTKVISQLFVDYLNGSLVEKIVCPNYILKSFHCFVNTKQEIRVNLWKLDSYCKNKGLLSLLFNNIICEKRVSSKDQNLFNKDLLKVFTNVNYLYIECWEYSFCLSSFLSLIDGTKVNKVDIYGSEWLPSIASSSSFDFICTQYQKANFKLQFNYDNTNLIISGNSL